MSVQLNRAAAAFVFAVFVPLAGCATLFNAGAENVAGAVDAAEPPPAGPVWFFPAMDWESITVGGRGGEIVKVTTLDNHGPGSLREALAKEGARIVVFEVGGVIDLEKETLVIANPNLTIAGQTAPSPGITLIRGGVDIKASDVIIQHLRVRPGDNGEARGSGFAEDSVSAASAHNLILDHCSLTWAVDENMSASGPRFTGETPEDWHEGTSRNILYSHNLVAEGLADATHPKFEHSKGSLIHDNVTGILIYANLYAHNYERNPLFKGGVHGQIVNNFIYDPGQRAVHYNLQGLEWGAAPFQTGRMDLIGNVMRGGQSTHEGLPLLMIGGDGDLELYSRGNIAVDWKGDALPERGRYSTGRAKIKDAAAPMPLPEGLPVMAAEDVERFVLANAGARPWDRDGHDVRVLANVVEGRGGIIDSQSEVGGYPKMTPAYRAFDPSLWDLETMLPKAPEALDSSQKGRGT
ncbi:MAG: pectate lyase [Hyphomonas sp.]|uniref:pectate lyase family protein n=1 Tax=Hyphomonas sp. TaxID=87 RepID=UPI001819B150|nr:pectate lyase [Hyphomonas sp.]MBU3922356.1 pectate lyase [Alphaproteobacteria bacterium]MBA3069934.1 pectate lyase [Hyphomonas sp.]MBU4060490.1 pectate lyase [Alphaproteobacteria bacterium]MBU4163158.1 pectate lyase [Alphaproteobacteria bacterium]MBU4567592.1 pectate lyase [Alphaproteobacteria bacterium]